MNLLFTIGIIYIIISYVIMILSWFKIKTILFSTRQKIIIFIMILSSPIIFTSILLLTLYMLIINIIKNNKRIMG